MAVPTPLLPPRSPSARDHLPAPYEDQSNTTTTTTTSNTSSHETRDSPPRRLSTGRQVENMDAQQQSMDGVQQTRVVASSSSAAAVGRPDKMAAIAEHPTKQDEGEKEGDTSDRGKGSGSGSGSGSEQRKIRRARSTTSLGGRKNNLTANGGSGVGARDADSSSGSNRRTNDTTGSESNGDSEGVSLSPRAADGSGNRGALNGERKSGQALVSSMTGFGLDTAGERNITHRASLAEPFEGAVEADGFEGTPSFSPPRNQDKDRERILKLSPSKMQELTASPQSIPYRAVPQSPDHGRRVVSDNAHATASRSALGEGSMSQVPAETKMSTDIVSKIRASKDPQLDDPSEALNSGIAKPISISSSMRSRPHASRTVSTPSSSSRRQQLPSSNSERLAQTWASRSKQDRPPMARAEGPEPSKHILSPSPQLTEPGVSSPVPQTIPLPPVSIPTYLQLELASGRPSPLYIHRSATSDFPYESARVKLERLMNFLMLPPAVEQVLWFGLLACLDSWLYSFTILPLRFIKAAYILLKSWAVNLGVEFRFVSGFVYNGVGRVWRRRNQAAASNAASTAAGSERGADSEVARSRIPAGKQEMSASERETRARSTTESRRRHRADTYRHHRRQKSIPSALLPDDKADILKGLLMVSTCWVLMYFDASRMYHWIRGQAAIKLYVIYNVLEVSDRLFAAIGQDVLECLFSREALERRPDGRSKVFRPFGLFLLALGYTVIHATSLFYQVMTLNVAVNSYSNALITLLLSNQFVEIKSTVFKKFEKENLFQLTCADVVERFQLWLMLTIIASRNIVETGAFNFVGSLGSGWSLGGNSSSSSTNSTPVSTPPRMASSILPQSFTIFPSSLISSFSKVNSFLPSLAQVLGPFLVVLGSEMLVDWLKHAYINKFNNTRPAIYGRFLDILAKDYYTNAFGDQNLTRRLGLPVIPLSCLFFRVSVQTYKMFLAASLPQPPSTTAGESTTALSSIHSHYVPAPIPSTPPLTLRTIIPSSVAHISVFFRSVLANAMPSPAQSVYIFTVVLLITLFIVLLIIKLLLGMGLLAYARSRYKDMKSTEHLNHHHHHHHNHHNHHHTNNALPNGTTDPRPREQSYAVEGSRRVGGWGVVEVNEDKRRWIYADDPEGLKRLKSKEEKDKKTSAKEAEMLNMDHVQRYEMVAKRIW